MVYVEQWVRFKRLSSASLSKTRFSFCLLSEQQQDLFALSDALNSLGHIVTFENERVDDSPEHLVWCLDDESSDKYDPAFVWLLCERVKQWVVRSHSKVALTLIGSRFVDPSGEGAVTHGRAAALACIAAINQELPVIVVNVLDTPMDGFSTPSQARHLAMAPIQKNPSPILWNRWYSSLSPSAPADLDDCKVCLVTGGLGSVGFGMAHYISRKFGADLVLIRRSVPSLNAWQTGQ